MRTKISRVLIALGLIAGGLAIAAPASASNNKDHKITYCHATPPQNAKNGWNALNTDKNAVFKNGHNSHSADIIPSFTYEEWEWVVFPVWGKYVTKTYPGKNLNTEFGWGVTGQEILNNGCKIPDRPVPSQPEDKITYGDWSDEIIDCQQGIVYKTRAVYTTPYVFDEKSWTWVPGETVTTSETETLREPTDQECGIRPNKPEDIYTYSEWVDGDYECGDTVVTQTRNKFVITHTFDEQLWDWVASEPEFLWEESRERNLNEDEIIPCNADPVTFTNHSCDAVGTFVIPEHDSDVVYRITVEGTGVWVARPAGTYYSAVNLNTPDEPVYDVTLTIMAVYAPAWPEIIDLGSWTYTFTNPGDCTVDEEPPATTVPPTTQPPATTPPTTAPTDTVPTDTVPVDVSSNTQTNTDPQPEVLSENVEAEELAFTGSNSKPMAALGAILLAAGLGLVAFDRKRKNIA